MTWWDTAVGRSHSVSRTFTAADVAAYNALIPDTAPDGGVPEPLVAGLFSTILGVHLPGPGTNYLKQALRFTGSARVGEVVESRVEVVRVVPDKRLVYLTTTCTAPDGGTVAEGEALVLAGGSGPGRRPITTLAATTPIDTPSRQAHSES